MRSEDYFLVEGYSVELRFCCDVIFSGGDLISKLFALESLSIVNVKEGFLFSMFVGMEI